MNSYNRRYPPIEESLARITINKPRTDIERRHQIVALKEEFNQIGDLNPGWGIDVLNSFPPVQKILDQIDNLIFTFLPSLPSKDYNMVLEHAHVEQQHNRDNNNRTTTIIDTTLMISMCYVRITIDST